MEVRVTVSVAGVAGSAVSALVPVRQRYLWTDLHSVARQAMGGIIPLRSLDYWIECACIVPVRQTPRTARYSMSDLEQFMWFLAHKRVYGRNQARKVFELSLREAS